jgi:quercetin dioxygenase-like cupin family protein
MNSAEPSSVAGLVEYQRDSVVSKTLVGKPSGTVTLFAFDKGQSLSEHTAPFDALVNVIDGKATVTISGKEHVVSAGELILMPANQPHAVVASERMKMLLIMIRS